MSDQPPDSPDPVKEIIDRALAELATLFAAETGESAAVCTNWVLIAEWSTVGPDEGAKWITRWYDEHVPVWYRNALLDHARNGDWSGAQSGPSTRTGRRLPDE